MVSGIQVVNNGGVLQIDETYRNGQLAAHVVWTTAGNHSLTIPNCQAPVVALYSVDLSGIQLLETQVAGSSFTWRTDGIGEIFVFDLPPNPAPSSGFGLQVFTSNGWLAFDAGFDQMRIVAIPYIYPFPQGDNAIDSTKRQTLSTSVTLATRGFGYNTVESALSSANSGVPYTKASGKKWAWVPMGDPRWWSKAGANPDFRGYFRYYWSGDNFKSYRHQIEQVPGGGFKPGNASRDQSLTFIDVTGIP